MKPIKIHTEYITLGQLLKLSDCIDSGGRAKAFLEDTPVSVNGEPDRRRGRKLYRGDKVSVEGFGEFEIV